MKQTSSLNITIQVSLLMEKELFHKKDIDKKISFFQSKVLFITIIGIAMGLIPTASYVNATPDTSNINQAISQIANQIATANPGLDTNKVSQTLEQLASQTASGGAGAGDVNQIISQIANQVAANPKGTIAQNIIQHAQQEAVSSLQGPITQQITQIAEQLATSTGADKAAVS